MIPQIKVANGLKVICLLKKFYFTDYAKIGEMTGNTEELVREFALQYRLLQNE